MNTQPFKELRVLMLGGPLAGPLAGSLLADLGCTVTQIDSPGKEPLLYRHEFVRGRLGDRIILDIKNDKERPHIEDLIRKADVVIDNLRVGALGNLRLGPDDISKLNPKAIHLSLPAFDARDKRFASLIGNEDSIKASAGVFTDVSLINKLIAGDPVYTSLPMASVYAAVHGALAVTVALIQRIQGGPGARLVVPLREALLSSMGSAYLEFENQPWRYNIPPVPKVPSKLMLGFLRSLNHFAGARGKVRASNIAKNLLPPFMRTYECADGKQIYIFAVEHKKLTKALLDAMGVLGTLTDTGLQESNIFADKVNTQNIHNSSTLGLRLRKTIVSKLSEAFKKQEAPFWEDFLNSRGIPAAVLRSTKEWKEDASVRSSGLIQTRNRDGGKDWATFACPISTTTLGTETKTRWKPINRHQSNDHPLTGLKVVDMSSMVAGPVSARTLADWGAEVIKVDPPIPNHGPLLTCWYGAEVNQSKSSVLIDAKKSDGFEALLALLSNADVLIHNFRPEAAKKLGVDAESLAKRLPHLVTCDITAYGSDTALPFKNWPGYDPVIQAATGIMKRYGVENSPEVHAIASCVDYLTGYVAALGITAALYEKLRLSTTRAVSVSLAKSAAMMQVLHLNEEEPKLIEDRKGTDVCNAIYMLADCAIYFSASEQSLLSVISKIPESERTQLVADSHKTYSVVKEYFKGMTLVQFKALLKGTGAQAIKVLSLAEIKRDVNELARVEVSNHPSGLRAQMLNPWYATFNGKRIGERKPFPKLGSDTKAVLQKIGMTASSVDALIASGSAATSLSKRYLPG